MFLRWLLALVLLALSPVAAAQPVNPPPAPPAPATPAVVPLGESLKGMAKAEYEAGKILFADGDYANAIVKFRTAHKESGDPRLHWNIAVCEKQLRQYSHMLVSIKRYQTEAEHLLSVEERDQAVAIIETVRAFISQFELTVDQEGAEVFIDGELIGKTPLPAGVTLDVGRRKLEVKKPGYIPIVQNITVPGGDVVKLELLMQRELHRGKLKVTATEGALISIDGKAVGLGSWEGSLPSGGHTLRVSADAMVPQQDEVLIEDGKTRSINIELEAIEESSTPTILWVVGGVTLATAGAITAALLYDPGEAPPVQGTIDPGSVQLSVVSW